MSDVKSIFSNSFSLYKENLDNPLYWAIMSNIGKVPPAIARGIMADTYNFYTRWEQARSKEEIDWSRMLEEAKQLSIKYNDCDLCKKTLLILMETIEEDFTPGGTYGK
jgi:hypothetical protein